MKALQLGALVLLAGGASLWAEILFDSYGNPELLYDDSQARAAGYIYFEPPNELMTTASRHAFMFTIGSPGVSYAMDSITLPISYVMHLNARIAIVADDTSRPLGSTIWEGGMPGPNHGSS